MKTSHFALALASLLGATDASAQLHVWLSQPIYSGASGNIQSDVAVGSNTGVWTYGMGNVKNSFDSWQISDFTQYNVGTPLLQYQTGYAPASNSYGSTSFQFKGAYVGMHLNSWTMPDNTAPPGPGGIPTLIKNATYGRGYLNIKPWATSYSGNPDACLSYSMRVPDYYTTGAALYVTSIYYIVDQATNKRISLDIGGWDNRGAANHEGYFTYDPYTISHIYSTYHGTGTTYASQSPTSHPSQTGKFNDTKWMSTCVSRQNLMNIINDANSRGLGFSTDVNNYVLDGVNVQAEIAIVNNLQGWFSTVIGDLWLVKRN